MPLPEPPTLAFSTYLSPPIKHPPSLRIPPHNLGLIPLAKLIPPRNLVKTGSTVLTPPPQRCVSITMTFPESENDRERIVRSQRFQFGAIERRKKALNLFEVEVCDRGSDGSRGEEDRSVFDVGLTGGEDEGGDGFGF
ncbi:hypothetical protein DOTSEDRAFT_34012 [Dothistroma septosporum NZE10]|uniref:Uncharacterized protein n=1 Tax=Dothistroma septosporum (strain NZE10 / CBS 128990) TaxID=675120 RepID=N1PSY3_DOTSN|nr:hypothetical protein DOTSEDRAFT_34012 [Dothistroma septosporum NZE10]